MFKSCQFHPLPGTPGAPLASGAPRHPGALVALPSSGDQGATGTLGPQGALINPLACGTPGATEVVWDSGDQGDQGAS